MRTFALPLLFLPMMLLQCEPAAVAPVVDTTTTATVVSTTVISTTTSPLSTTTTVAPSTTMMAPYSPGLLPASRWANWSNWRVSTEGVPYYAGRVACSAAQAHTIAVVFKARGASLDTQRWAIYVASREGGCNYQAVNINNRTRDNSHCTFQLNARSGGPLSPAGILGKLGWTPTSVKASLSACATAGAALWAICGKGPWIKGDYGCRRPSS